MGQSKRDELEIPPLDEYYVAVTANTEYYVAFQRCVAVRRRASGEWDRRHRILGQRFKGGVFGKDSEFLISGPMVGVSLWFRTADGTDMLTSRVEALRRATETETDFCLDSRYWSQRTTTSSGVTRSSAKSIAAMPDEAEESSSRITREFNPAEVAQGLAAQARAEKSKETGLPDDESVDAWLAALIDEDDGPTPSLPPLPDSASEGPERTMMTDKFFLEKKA